MVICEKCKTNSANENWCSGCGAPLSPESERVVMISKEKRNKATVKKAVQKRHIELGDVN